MVPFNDLLTYLDGCNTAIYPLGSTEAAKVKVYYMTKYIVKDQGAFKKLISIAATAYNLTVDHPNIHVDKYTGTNREPMDVIANDSNGVPSNDNSTQNARGPQTLPSLDVEYNSVKRFGNTLLNSLRTTYERSSQESASKILG